MKTTDILLASGSPRRRELLAMIGVTFDICVADIDEAERPGESPTDYVNRLAAEKAATGRRLGGAARPVLGADTIVLLHGKILGKPESQGHAGDMLARLSGQTHEVYSGVAVIDTSGQMEQRLSITSVTFGTLPADWIDWYCTTAEPMDKAGAYAIQGVAAQWVRHIEGSYSGVMGLPLYETAQLLRQAGVSCRSLIAGPHRP